MDVVAFHGGGLLGERDGSGGDELGEGGEGEEEGGGWFGKHFEDLSIK